MGIVSSKRFVSPVRLYPYRYVFFKVSSIVNRQARPGQEMVPMILSPAHELGLFRNIAAYAWLNGAPPIEFHAGETVEQRVEPDPLRADWIGRTSSVSVIGQPTNTPRAEDELLLSFLAQQIGVLLTSQQARLTNLALQTDLDSLNETLTLRKIINRAQSLLANRHGISFQAAIEMLDQASREHSKPILKIAQEVVAVLGNPVLSFRPKSNRRSSRSRAA